VPSGFCLNQSMFFYRPLVHMPQRYV
jgi:hypothetical protein